MTPIALRRTFVVIAVLTAIATPAIRAILDLGLSQAAFAADGDGTLRAAPYAFSIWGVIYLALLAYAAYQVRARETPALAAFGWPSVIAMAACAGWIVAAAVDLKVLSVAIIVIGAAAAIRGLMARARPTSLTERTLVIWPNALLAGWLTIASAISLLTTLTALGQIAPAEALGAALGAVAVVIVFALWVAFRAGSAIYLLPIAWGLMGVHVAERTDKPLLAEVALACAIGLVLAALALRPLLRRRP